MSTPVADGSVPVRARWRSTGQMLLFAALGLGAGAVAGVIWWAVVDLPTYQVSADGGAATTERGLTEFIGGDAWFVVLGLLAGVTLGVTSWRLFGRVGWPVVVLASAVAFVAGLVCWIVGMHLGPGDFNTRLAAATPGTQVPIELTIRARASLVAWPLFAVIPVLLGASLGRDADEPDPEPTRAPAP